MTANWLEFCHNWVDFWVDFYHNRVTIESILEMDKTSLFGSTILKQTACHSTSLSIQIWYNTHNHCSPLLGIHQAMTYAACTCTNSKLTSGFLPQNQLPWQHNNNRNMTFYHSPGGFCHRTSCHDNIMTIETWLFITHQWVSATEPLTMTKKNDNRNMAFYHSSVAFYYHYVPWQLVDLHCRVQYCSLPTVPLHYWNAIFMIIMYPNIGKVSGEGPLVYFIHQILAAAVF